MRWNAHHLGQPVLQSSVRSVSDEDEDEDEGVLRHGELLDFAFDNENEFVLRVEHSEEKSPEKNDAHIYQVCMKGFIVRPLRQRESRGDVLVFPSFIETLSIQMIAFCVFFLIIDYLSLLLSGFVCTLLITDTAQT